MTSKYRFGPCSVELSKTQDPVAKVVCRKLGHLEIKSGKDMPTRVAFPTRPNRLGLHFDYQLDVVPLRGEGNLLFPQEATQANHYREVN